MIFIVWEKCFLLLVGIFDDRHLSLMMKAWILPPKAIDNSLMCFFFKLAGAIFCLQGFTLPPLPSVVVVRCKENVCEVWRNSSAGCLALGHKAMFFLSPISLSLLPLSPSPSPPPPLSPLPSSSFSSLFLLFWDMVLPCSPEGPWIQFVA